jgi:hypothetical protein
MDRLTKEKEGDVMCTGCLTLVNAVEALIASEATEEKIEAVADQICNAFNGTAFFLPCKNTVDKSIDKIIEWVMERYDANYICQKLHLCQEERELFHEQKFEENFLNEAVDLSHELHHHHGHDGHGQY